MYTHTRAMARAPPRRAQTALVLQLCLKLRDQRSIGVVTNDIFTREDAEFLTRHDALPPARIRAVETGGCPHAAIREVNERARERRRRRARRRRLGGERRRAGRRCDVGRSPRDDTSHQTCARLICFVLFCFVLFCCVFFFAEDVSSNLAALEDLTRSVGDPTPEILLCESGGDNLAANFSRELADYTIYVIDVAGGDKARARPPLSRSPASVASRLSSSSSLVPRRGLSSLGPYLLSTRPRSRGGGRRSRARARRSRARAGRASRSPTCSSSTRSTSRRPSAPTSA